MGVRQKAGLGIGQRFAVVACCGALILPALSPVLAQDSAQDGGLQMTLGVRSTLRSDSNYSLSNPSNGRGTVFDTQLSFGLISETRNSRLAFTASTTARAARLPAPAGSVSGIEDPLFQLNYSREGARSSLTLNARYNRADLDFVDPLTDQVLIADPSAPGGLTLVNATGTRTNLQYGLGFRTGIDMPVGLNLQLNHRELDYSGTVGPSLYDTQTDSATLGLRFDLTPAMTANVTLSASDYVARDAASTRRENRSLSFGLSQNVSEALNLSANVGLSRNTTTRLGASTLREGATFALAATRNLPTGNVGLSYSRSIDSNGNRDTLRVSHSQETQLLSAAMSLGLTRGSSGTTSIVANANISRDFARGELSASLSRGVTTNDSLNDVLTTRANAAYTHNINPVSSLAFGVTFARTEDGGTGVTTTTDRSSVNITYNRALTEDWDMSAGFEHRRLTNTAGTAQGNAVFVSLGRSFDLRP